MGSKPSNNFQMDRPESGGADRKDERESAGILEREKQRFAAAEPAKHEGPPHHRTEPTASGGDQDAADGEGFRPPEGSG